MTLLNIVQDASNIMGFPPPTVVMSSTDQRIMEMLQIANISGKILARRFNWQEITRQALFTATAQLSQGTINSHIVTDGDFDRIVNQTMWNRSEGIQCTGPITGVEWQQDQAYMIVSPNPKFRIWLGQIWIGPTAATSGDVYAFEYVSKWWCQSSLSQGQGAWAADSDTGIISEDLLTLDLVWRYKASKSLEYADDLQTFEDEFAKRAGQTTGARPLYLGGANVIFPVNVPEGNWPTT